MFDWLLVFCLLVIAVIATAVWSYVDRKRESYATLAKWFRVFLRFALAGQLISYGLVKAVPLQMPYPYLGKLVEPFGDFSPMGVLWSSIGASPAYETFAGCAELMGGLLLIFPRTTMLGALISLADMIQVFMLNMTYDVPVKLLSFHLILLSLFLLAPDLRRLARFFLSIADSSLRRAFGSFLRSRANRIAFACQIVLGLWLLGDQSGLCESVRMAQLRRWLAEVSALRHLDVDQFPLTVKRVLHSSATPSDGIASSSNAFIRQLSSRGRIPSTYFGVE